MMLRWSSAVQKEFAKKARVAARKNAVYPLRHLLQMDYVRRNALLLLCLQSAILPRKAQRKRSISFTMERDRSMLQAETSIPAPPRAVLKNMCKGIEGMKCSPDNEIELTAVPKSQRSTNRKAMCPKKWCAKGVNDYIKSIHPASLYPTGTPELAKEALTVAADMSCDEFPFARSHEGGNLQFGTRICIPANENSWQGGTMSGFFKKWLDKAKAKANPNYIAPNEKFVVKIVGWNCKENAPVKKDAMSVNVNITGSKFK